MAFNKSTVTQYNNTNVTVTEDLTTIPLGTVVLQSGCSICPQTSGFLIRSTGIYRISYDVTFTPTAAGDVVFQLYSAETALPCALVTDTAESANVVTVHLETTICIGTCNVITPIISAKISGVAGDINHACANVTRVA